MDSNGRLSVIGMFLGASVASPLCAQLMPGMPGRSMTPPAHDSVHKHRPSASNKVLKRAPAKPVNGSHPTKGAQVKPLLPAAHGAAALPSQDLPGSPMDMPMRMPATTPAKNGAGMAGMERMPAMGAEHAMVGALGAYSANGEASGTAWQPDSSDHRGLMRQAGDWSLMAHGVLNLVADHQGSRRGADKLFPSGMLMAMASRPVANGTLQFKAMVSPDPLMGKAGYPLLLASGETADGTTRLIDRQHPHDLFMELSASVSQRMGANGSLFLYGGLPGEPAFGPPAFMHREAIMDSPEAPITHHWLDSTHIAFGVVTAGAVLGNAKMEVSRFNGREPDQHRYDIETGPLDSTAVRVSWNPVRTLALQASWGHFVDPEQLELGVDQKRLSMSALYADEIAPGYKIAATLAWGRKTVEGRSDDGFAAETSVRHGPWTAFGRAEMTTNRELVGGLENGPSYRVGKASFGLVRDYPITPHLRLGVGGLMSVNAVPAALAGSYGSRHPTGAMAFVRMKTD